MGWLIDLAKAGAPDAIPLAAETENLREAFEERAAVLEYDTGLPRPEAELEAARITATLARNRGYAWASLRAALADYPALLSQVPDGTGPVDALPFGVARLAVLRGGRVVRQGGVHGKDGEAKAGLNLAAWEVQPTGQIGRRKPKAEYGGAPFDDPPGLRGAGGKAMAGNSEGSTKRRGPGKPFPPGVSGNPAGRPGIVAEIRDLARQHTADAIAALVAIMQKGESDAARVSAANALLDRGYGRPVAGGPVMLDEIGGTLSEQGRAIIEGMAKGKLTPAEASQLLSGLAAFGKIIEADELAKRVERLEGKANGNT